MVARVGSTAVIGCCLIGAMFGAGRIVSLRLQRSGSLELATRWDPGNYVVATQAAQSKLEQGDCDGAVALVDRALALNDHAELARSVKRQCEALRAKRGTDAPAARPGGP
jgi:hypothetical protein